LCVAPAASTFRPLVATIMLVSDQHCHKVTVFPFAAATTTTLRSLCVVQTASTSHSPFAVTALVFAPFRARNHDDQTYDRYVYVDDVQRYERRTAKS
jgi:hypothetical protein